MSNQARLILLSGSGGSGTTTLADATVAAARVEGLRAVGVDAGGCSVGDDTRRSLHALAGALAPGLDADGVPVGIWTGLPTVRHLAAWDRIVQELARPDVDVVIVDCGSLREAQVLAEFPTVVGRLLAAALTPSMAMRSTSPTEPGETAGAGFDVVAGFVERVLTFARLLESRRTTMRLVTVPEAAPLERTLRAQAVFALLGIQVEAIIVNRFGRKSEGLGQEVVAEQRTQLDRAEQGSAGAWVWKSTTSLRPVPKDRSVVGPLGGGGELRSGELEPRVEDEAFSLTLPLVGAAAAEARVGRCRDDLVVEFAGVQRWLPLPAVLRRCRAVTATRSSEGLVVSFVPDASLWRSTPEPERAA